MKTKEILIITLIFFVIVMLLINLQVKDISQTKEFINPNIILITFDALSANYLSVYGFDKETAPNLKNFSKESYVFSNVISQSGTTQFSLCSLFTSRYPFKDDLIGEVKLNLTTPDLEICKKSTMFLPYLLQEKGYNTYGVVRNGGTTSNFGLDHGFDYFDESATFTQPCSRKTFETASKLIENKINEPFFFWIHNNEPHSPYLPPEGYFSMFYTNKSAPTIYHYLRGIYPNISNNDFCFDFDKLYSENGKKLYERYRKQLSKISQYNDSYRIYGKHKNLTKEELIQTRSLYLANIRYADEQFGKFYLFLKNNHITTILSLFFQQTMARV